MRILVATLILCAGMSKAAPDCAEGPQLHRSKLAALESHDGILEVPATTTGPDKEVTVSPRPPLRPCRFRQFEVGRARMRARGAVCGDWTILGETRTAIVGVSRGCGIARPVQIHRVSDIFLSQRALMDCETAVTFKTWIENTAKPAFAKTGGGLKGLRLVGHYACKTQNNQARARLSEHARGRAIDVSDFVLMDGTIISVRTGWDDEIWGEVLRELHSGACGLFGTVLGPDSDRYHKGHFHLDTARRSSGPVCR